MQLSRPLICRCARKLMIVRRAVLAVVWAKGTMARTVLLGVAAAASVAEAAFYLPGVAPKSYKTRDNVRWGRLAGACVGQRSIRYTWKNDLRGRVVGFSTAQPPLLPRRYQVRTDPPPRCLQVPLFVNKVTSTKTQLPYSYYDLPFCKVGHPSSAPLEAFPAL